MRLNKRLIPLKIHFFFFFGCMAPILPFIMVMAVQLGIPIPLQGSLSAFSLLFTIVGKPLVAALADVFPSYRKALFLATISIMVASFSAINFIPPLQEPITVQGILMTGFKSSDDDSPPVIDSQFLRASGSVDPEEHGSVNRRSSKILDQSIRSLEANLPIDTIKAGNFSDRLILLVTTFDHSATHITSGRGCSFVCFYTKKCPNNSFKANEVLTDFTLKLVPSSEAVQMISAYSSSVLNDPLSSHNESNMQPYVNALSHGSSYELEGAGIQLASFKTNVSIECISGERRLGDPGGGHDEETRGGGGAWRSWQFWLLGVFLVVGQLSFNTGVSITDAIAIDTVGDDGSYGVQRAWGTIGWGLMAPISGLLVDWWSGGSPTKDYSAAFLLCFIAGSLDVILSSVCLKIPEIKEEQNILKKLWPLLKKPRFFVFCCFVVLNGCFDGIVVNYIFVMQEDMARGTNAMGNMKFLQGLTLLVQGAVEAPFMFFNGWFMKKLGAQKVTSLVFFLYIFRLLGLFVVGQYGSVWTTLIPELLNGPCYGLGYTAIVVYAANITPEGTSNTVQSAVNICYESFGYALAMFLGGFIYAQVGGPYMYLMASGVATLTFIAHFISLQLLPPPQEVQQRRQERERNSFVTQSDRVERNNFVTESDRLEHT